jgi:hypothetical protein
LRFFHLPDPAKPAFLGTLDCGLGFGKALFGFAPRLDCSACRCLPMLRR